MNLGGISASVLLHVGLFAVITRTHAPLAIKEKTAIRVIEAKPEPPPPLPEPTPVVEAAPVPEAAPKPADLPKPEPKPKKPEPVPEPSNDAPPPSTAPPLDLGNMTFTNDRGDGPSVSPDSLGGDPTKPQPKPKPRAVEKPDGEPSKPKSQAAECAEELVKAKAIDKVSIEYPTAAREQGIEGQLVLRAKIGVDGTVIEVEVVRSAGALIDEPAVAALKQWTFSPATLCGKPTASTFTISRRFELGT